MSDSVNRSLEAWSWGGSIARMLEDAGGLEGSIMLDIARSTAEDSARVQGELLTRAHTGWTAGGSISREHAMTGLRLEDAVSVHPGAIVRERRGAQM